VKIAFDGGAFQQDIAGGIFSVSVGLLNAAAALDPQFSCVLVADSRLGPLREALLAQLNVRPEIIYAEVTPAFDPPLRGITTEDPRIRFEIDGRLFTPRAEGLAFTYTGPRPRESFHLRSRAARPSDTRGGGDNRMLGVALRAITLRDDNKTRLISVRDPALGEGFEVPEPGYRWTNGRARIPLQLLASEADEVTISVEIAGAMTYQVMQGRFDDRYNAVIETSRASERRLRIAALEDSLLEMGVTTYFANHFMPVPMERLRIVSFLHDMIPVLHKDFFMADARANFARNIAIFHRSAHIFANSASSRADLIRLENLAPERVSHIGIDIAPEYQRQPAAKVAELQQRLGLATRPYILCVGTLEPRKNHLGLLVAFDIAFRERGFPYDLVVVGKPGWGFDGFTRGVAERGMGDIVHRLSQVSNAELAALYSGAFFSAYPSLYEGFGLPVLEAMACGCPVLTSNIASMPEITGDAAMLVNPHDHGAIAAGLVTMAEDDGMRAMLVERGHRRRRAYSWARSARMMLDTLAKLDGDLAA